MQDGFRPFSPYAFCCRPLRVPSTTDRRFLRAAYQESAPNVPKPCSNEGCKYACIITSSIRQLYPAAFRTDATPAKESVPCTFDRDQTHTDTSGSSSTDRFASLLVRVRRGGTAGIVGRSSPASGTLSVGLIACAAKPTSPRRTTSSRSTRTACRRTRDGT